MVVLEEITAKVVVEMVALEEEEELIMKVVAVVVIPEARVDSLKGVILVVAVAVPTIREPIKVTPLERTKATERSSSPCTLPQATRVSLQ